MNEFNPEVKEVIENFNKEVSQWIKNNKLTVLPEYVKLQDKVTLGTHYRLDQVYFEQLTYYKSTYFGLVAYLNSLTASPDRDVKRYVERTVELLQSKIKEIDSLLDSGRNRLQFYKTVVYMIGNAIYGIE